MEREIGLEKQKLHFTIRRKEKEDFSREIKMKEDAFYKLVGDYWRSIIKNLTILNVGCGPYPLRFGAKREIGLDPLVDFYRSLYPPRYYQGMELIRGFASRIDLEDSSIDLVYSNKALEYMEDWEESLKEMHRVLKRGSYIVLIYHSQQSDGINLNLLSKVDMKRYLEITGFTVLEYSKDLDSLVKIFATKL